MSKAAAKTGLNPTVFVAMEQLYSKNQRGIEDEFAYKILPSTKKSLVRLMRFESIRERMIQVVEKGIPGTCGGIICRKRYIDQELINSINQISAVVDLGVGFETRVFRLAGLSNKLTFDVDQPEIIEKKKTQLLKIFGTIPQYLKLVSVDFDKEDLNSTLKSYGYSPVTKTFYIMEGVTQYLTENGIKATFNFLSKAASGSHLVFTYLRKDFIDGQNMYNWKNGYIKFVVNDKLWLFGMNPEEWPSFLKQYGWQVIEDVSYVDLSEKYVPKSRGLASTPVERIIHAKKL